MNLLVGTAGHIDHGKTALVKALTGVDADRLPEEKQRGITIDLGFAELRIGDLDIGFVDVPGHERFVRNMLAGASGIDLVLLVVAADEGVMPQTREHFEICRLLGTQSGIVVLTKKDLVDNEMLDLAKLDVGELVENSFLENAPLIAVSSKSGEGIDELQAAIEAVAGNIPQRSAQFLPRLPIDRSFTIKGFGSVVTGTLLAGEMAAGSELELWPGRKRVRVRGVQTQGRTVERASAGQRTALNLGGIDHSELERGMVLAEPGAIEPTQIVDTLLEVVPGAARAVRSRQRVRFHIGAAEVLGRVHVLNESGEILSGGKGYVQLRLELPVVAVPGDRFVVRSYSPQATIAGGEVLDAHGHRHRKRDLGKTTAFLARLSEARDQPTAQIAVFIEAAGKNGLALNELRVKTGLLSRVVDDAVDALVENGRVVRLGGHAIAADAFSELKTRASELITDVQKSDPLAGGISREAVRDRIFAFIDTSVFNKAIGELVASGNIASENEILKPACGTYELSVPQTKALDGLRQIFRDDNFEVPKLDEAIRDVSAKYGTNPAETRKIFQILVTSNEVIKVSSEFYFNRQAIDSLVSKMRKQAAMTADRLINVPAFKSLAGISRKYAIPLLEYFDSSSVTVRLGDKRRVI